jgi:patatin-like phospholipase/acyl hydrolase
MSLPFRTLGLGGGGVKGILHIGALLELSKKQPLVFPDGVYGISVGSVIGTYLAFGLPFNKESVPDLKNHLKFSNFANKVDIKAVSDSFSTKGMYSMDLFENFIVKLFESKGINIKEKVIGDANMPLYIIASNVTKGTPTVFSKNVPVIDALKCSCAVPGIFRPQVLYKNVYIDGDLFAPSVDKFIPNLNDAICFSLKKRMITNNFKPENIENMSPLSYIYGIHGLIMQNFYEQVKSKKTLCLHYPGLRSTSDIDDFDIDQIMNKAADDLNRFLK